MKSPNASSPPPDGKEPSFLKTAKDGWNNFWFTPADPIVLGIIRIGVGLLALYTLIVYTPDLQNLFGANALMNLELRGSQVRDSPWSAQRLNWPPDHVKPPEAKTPQQAEYRDQYLQKWNEWPPLPWPSEENFEKEAQEYDDFRTRWGGDKRQAIAVGTPVWSIWFHITDPPTMLAIHLLFIFITLLFTIGCGSRVTSVLVWMIYLTFNHRSSVTLFGYDTMMVITLMYLMIAPSGAALSVDRLIARWWRSRTSPDTAKRDDRPQPSLTANLAIRLLQIHLCFIYGAAGLAKLKGTSWWTGEAVWGTIANYEFAPMSSGVYMWILSTLTANQVVLQTFLLVGTYFTLFFEICYPFLIWNKYTRWLMLFMAVVLHGLIGLIMGLRTFALIMLVMNLAFVSPPVIYWLKDKFKNWFRKILLPSFVEPKAEPTPVGAGVASAAEGKQALGNNHFKDLRGQQLSSTESRKLRRRKR